MEEVEVRGKEDEEKNNKFLSRVIKTMERKLKLNQKEDFSTLNKPRMLLIGLFYNLWDEEYIARTFESLGWYVERLEANKTTVESILQDIKTEQYRFLFTVNRQIKGDFSKILGKIKTVFWLFDLYYGTPREKSFNFNPLFRCDFVFSTDGGHQEEFLQSRINHYILRQGIYEEDAYIGQKRKEYEKDVIFVGTLSSIHKNRDKLLSFLQNTYNEKFKWWGRSGPNEIRGRDLNDLYASVKIVVGDTCYSPNYWSNRIYEVLGRGGFLIFPDIPGLEKEFEYEKHLVTYKSGDYQDLKVKIDYYLYHKNKKEKIRLAGFEYCKKNHSFKNRCLKLLEIINEK